MDRLECRHAVEDRPDVVPDVERRDLFWLHAALHAEPVQASPERGVAFMSKRRKYFPLSYAMTDKHFQMRIG